MSTVHVYDPAMCCPTGVCGPSVDPALTQFSADLEWLGRTGVEVARFGLATEPGEFAKHSEITTLMQEKGEDALPAVVVDGTLRCNGRYPTRLELADWTGARTERPSLSLASESDSEGDCGCGPEGC